MLQSLSVFPSYRHTHTEYVSLDLLWKLPSKWPWFGTAVCQPVNNKRTDGGGWRVVMKQRWWIQGYFLAYFMLSSHSWPWPHPRPCPLLGIRTKSAGFQDKIVHETKTDGRRRQPQAMPQTELCDQESNGTWVTIPHSLPPTHKERAGLKRKEYGASWTTFNVSSASRSYYPLNPYFTLNFSRLPFILSP